MARLFTYGKLKRVATLPGKNHLPGTYYTAYGIQYGAGAFNNTANDMEPGEIVEIDATSDKGYSVKRATSSLTADTAAIVIRDIMGVRAIEEGIFKDYKPGVPMTVVPASAPHGWAISVPLASGEPSVGDAVYVGLGTGATTVGAIYATAQGDAGVDSIELTDWTFASTRFQPTDDDSYAVIIQKL